MAKGKLIVLLYLLLRDHLTVGQMEDLLVDLNEAVTEDLQHEVITGLATQYAERLSE